MNENRLPDYLAHMLDAAQLACSYTEKMSKEDFLADTRTQDAVIMNLVKIGEATTKVMELNSEFVTKHPQIPWRSMRGMRNRLAHGYFDINLDTVWDTVQTALPQLLQMLPSVRNDAIHHISAADKG